MVWTIQGRPCLCVKIHVELKKCLMAWPKLFPTTCSRRFFSFFFHGEGLKSWNQSCAKKVEPSVDSVKCAVHHFQCIVAALTLQCGELNGIAELFILDTLDLVHLRLVPLCGVCMVSLCLRGLSFGTPASSCSSNNMHVRGTGNF